MEIASSRLSFFVFKDENSTKHTVRCDSNDKYQCDCEFSKVYSLPCRHVLHIVATQDLCIFASYSYLPRWLKESPFDIDESSSDSIHSFNSTQSVSSTNSIKRKLNANNRYHLFKPIADLHMSYMTNLSQLSEPDFREALAEYQR